MLARLEPRLHRFEHLCAGGLPGRRSVAQHEAIISRAELGDARGRRARGAGELDDAGLGVRARPRARTGSRNRTAALRNRRAGAELSLAMPPPPALLAAAVLAASSRRPRPPTPPARRRACPAAAARAAASGRARSCPSTTATRSRSTSTATAAARGVDVRFAGGAGDGADRPPPEPGQAPRRVPRHRGDRPRRAARPRPRASRVRLTAEHASSRSDSRLARHVAVRRGGRWQDVGAILMAEGHALLPRQPEGAGLEPPLRRAQPAGRARRARALGPGALRRRPRARTCRCRSGPTGTRPASTTSTSTASGPRCATRARRARSRSPAGGSATACSAASRSRRARRSQPGQTLTLHTGRGTDRGLTRYWGLGVTLYPNVGPDHLGDGAYLFDPQGDLRASMTYPCLVACEHPDQGALALAADPRGRASL